MQQDEQAPTPILVLGEIEEGLARHRQAGLEPGRVLLSEDKAADFAQAVGKLFNVFPGAMACPYISFQSVTVLFDRTLPPGTVLIASRVPNG